MNIKKLDTLDNRHKQEMKKVKQELEESDIKDKNKVIKKLMN